MPQASASPVSGEPTSSGSPTQPTSRCQPPSEFRSRGQPSSSPSGASSTQARVLATTSQPRSSSSVSCRRRAAWKMPGKAPGSRGCAVARSRTRGAWPRPPSIAVPS